MTTKQEQINTSKKTKFYIPKEKQTWIDRVPGYITHKQAKNLSTQERERLLNTFTGLKPPLPDLPPIARIRLFKQYLLQAEAIWEFDCCVWDPRPLPDIREETLFWYIQHKRREWCILGGAERQRNKEGPKFFINLWDNLDTLDIISSEEYSNWEFAAGRIQYQYRVKLSDNKGHYLVNYLEHSSGYRRGPFEKEFRRKQLLKDISREFLSSSGLEEETTFVLTTTWNLRPKPPNRRHKTRGLFPSGTTEDEH